MLTRESRHGQRTTGLRAERGLDELTQLLPCLPDAPLGHVGQPIRVPDDRELRSVHVARRVMAADDAANVIENLQTSYQVGKGFVDKVAGEDIGSEEQPTEEPAEASDEAGEETGTSPPQLPRPPTG